MVAIGHFAGRSKPGGVDLGRLGASAVALFHGRDGGVARLVRYLDSARAADDLGLER